MAKIKGAITAIDVVDIAGPERERLLALEEGHFADLKGIEVALKKLARTISAFANSVGGDLYVGISESEFFGTKIRQWRGFADQEAANGHLQSIEALFPLGAEYSYEFLRAAGSPGLLLKHLRPAHAANSQSARQNSLHPSRRAEHTSQRGCCPCALATRQRNRKL